MISLAQAAKYIRTVVKDYLFHLISGPDMQTNFDSARYIMNSVDSKKSRDKITIKTLIALHQNRTIILMQATKKTEYGKELLCD